MCGWKTQNTTPIGWISYPLIPWDIQIFREFRASWIAWGGSIWRGESGDRIPHPTWQGHVRWSVEGPDTKSWRFIVLFPQTLENDVEKWCGVGHKWPYPILRQFSWVSFSETLFFFFPPKFSGFQVPKPCPARSLEGLLGTSGCQH